MNYLELSGYLDISGLVNYLNLSGLVNYLDLSGLVNYLDLSRLMALQAVSSTGSSPGAEKIIIQMILKIIITKLFI